MSRFYFSFLGNKRKELRRLFNVIDLDAFTTVVEPFCGSAALSLEIHARGLGKRLVLNDSDLNLMATLEHIKDAGTSAGLYDYCRDKLTLDEWRRHQALNKDGHLTPEQWFYHQRVRGSWNRAIRVPDKWPALVRGPRQISSDACFSDPETLLTCGDWRHTMDLYKDDPAALIFLDPPYFSSWNQEYYGMKGAGGPIDPAGHVVDGTTIFIEILEYLKTAAATIVVTTNSVAIIDHIFAAFVVVRYPKRYAGTVKTGDQYVNKNTHHLVLVGGGHV